VGWADGLKRSGQVEEFSLAPATLEDVYVELVGGPTRCRTATELTEPALSNGRESRHKIEEATRVAVP